MTDSFPDWKVRVLEWMKYQYSESDGFPSIFMKDLKQWSSSSEDKKNMKNVMQFASFTKKEVEDVGSIAMDTQLPFDQSTVLENIIDYIKKQTNLDEIDVIKQHDDIPPKVSENVALGKPYLWLR